MPSDRFAALSSARYRRYWYGSLASVGGTQFAMLGQAWLVYELSNSPFSLGMLGAASAIPNIIVSLFGGALADRLDKRLVIMATSAVSAASLLVLALLDASGHVEVWHVLSIVALTSIVSGLDWPTRQALFPHLIDRAHMTSAVALNSIVWQGTRMAMPALGGVLIALADTWVVFVLAALGNVAMLIAVVPLAVETPARSAASTVQQVTEGVRFIIDTPLFFVLISLSYVAMFFTASYVQLLPAFVALLGAGGEGYGMLMSASGVGAVFGTLIAGSLQQSRNLGRLMLAASGGSAIALYAFCAIAASGLPFAFHLALAAALLSGALSSIFLILSMTVMQLEVPEALRGRVMGVHGITYSLMSLGALVVGSLAEVGGAPLAVAIAASVHLGYVVRVWLKASHLRDMSGASAAA